MAKERERGPMEAWDLLGAPGYKPVSGQEALGSGALAWLFPGYFVPKEPAGYVIVEEVREKKTKEL